MSSTLKLKLSKKSAIESKSTVDKINDYLFKTYNKAPDYESKPSHSPSTLGAQCYRKIYYHYFRVEKDTKVGSRGARIFETGKYYEDMVLSWLKAVNEHIPYRNKTDGNIPLERDGSGKPNPQFPISIDDWRIRKGFIDNVAIVDAQLWLYEIKSCGSKKFVTLEAPLPEHTVQVTCYYTAFNDHLDAGDYKHIPELAKVNSVAGVKVIYVNKDTSEIAMFTLTPETLTKSAEVVTTKLAEVNKYIDSRDLPPKTVDNCFFCPYGKKCKSDKNVP
jgi:hypothetical protein